MSETAIKKTARYNSVPAPGHFVHLFEPVVRVSEGGEKSKPTYEMTLVLRKNKPQHAEFAAFVMDLMEKKCIEAFGKPFDELVKKRNFDPAALRDGDHSDRPEWKGCWYMRLRGGKKPRVIDRTKNKEDAEPEACYSGAIYVVNFNLYAWRHPTGKYGISAGLNNVMKYADGEPMDGRTDPHEDFKEYQDDEEYSTEPASAGERLDASALEDDDEQKPSSVEDKMSRLK